MKVQVNLFARVGDSEYRSHGQDDGALLIVYEEPRYTPVALNCQDVAVAKPIRPGLLVKQLAKVSCQLL